MITQIPTGTAPTARRVMTRRVVVLTADEAEGAAECRRTAARYGAEAARPAPWVVQLAAEAARTCYPSHAQLRAAGYMYAWRADWAPLL